MLEVVQKNQAVWELSSKKVSSEQGQGNNKQMFVVNKNINERVSHTANDIYKFYVMPSGSIQ